MGSFPSRSPAPLLTDDDVSEGNAVALAKALRSLLWDIDRPSPLDTVRFDCFTYADYMTMTIISVPHYRTRPQLELLMFWMSKLGVAPEKLALLRAVYLAGK